jgi:signal transduction histidine kinase
MELVHQFFTQNHDILLFGYGLVFFILGLAIALQSRRYSRLNLARNVSWLAVFGILHGLQEWGDLFIPIQARYLSEPVVQFLSAGQLLLLSISFIGLFEFGISILVSLGWDSRAHLIAPILLVAWILGAYYIALPLSKDFSSWHRIANALARYFICFPGGLLASYGLWREVRERVRPYNVPEIARTLWFAVAALALYALFAGLIVPPIEFFPGTVLNSRTFEAWLGIPPLVARSLIGLVLTVSVIRGLDIFDVEVSRMIDAMEEKQILATERERLARELHDGTIQTVYTAGLLVESARRLLPQETPGLDRLVRAEALLDDTIRELRQNLVSLNKPPTTLSLSQVLNEVAQDPRYATLIKISLKCAQEGSDEFPPDRMGHIRSITVEALSNVVRHSHARHVLISCEHLENEMYLNISDDGQGLKERVNWGYGLRNMRDRARLLGGRVEIDSWPGKGTTISLVIPWEETHAED